MVTFGQLKQHVHSSDFINKHSCTTINLIILTDLLTWWEYNKF